MRVSWRIDKIAKYANVSNKGARKTDLSSIDDEELGKHDGISFVKIATTFAARDMFFMKQYHFTELSMCVDQSCSG